MPPAPLLRAACGGGLALVACLALGTARAQTPLTDGTMQRIELIQAESQGLQRALNLARETATKLNGGLRVYRPASCMYAGASRNPCLIERDGDGFLFRFQGGAPGWQQLGLPASFETEIRVARDGRSVSAVLYNGPPR